MPISLLRFLVYGSPVTRLGLVMVQPTSLGGGCRDFSASTTAKVGATR